jgi:hypothetical protein
MARVKPGQAGQHPDNPDLSGDISTRTDRTGVYRPVRLSGVRTMHRRPDRSLPSEDSLSTRADDWTTRVLPDLTRQHGVEELHTAWFTPKAWPGKGPAVSLLIPECEMQVVVIAADGQPIAVVNRPKTNKNVKRWVRTVCETARDLGACVSFAGDTAEQVERAAKAASKLLPSHERAALERLYDAGTRARASLN